MSRNWLTLFVSCLAIPALAVASTKEASERAKLSASIWPVSKSYYLEIPAANNPLSNLMIRAAVGQAPWVQELADLMEVGSRETIYLVVGSANDGVARAALAKAIGRVKSKRLDGLHLGLLGDVSRGEKLRESIEATGAEFRVAPSKP